MLSHAMHLLQTLPPQDPRIPKNLSCDESMTSAEYCPKSPDYSPISPNYNPFEEALLDYEKKNEDALACDKKKNEDALAGDNDSEQFGNAQPLRAMELRWVSGALIGLNRCRSAIAP